MADCGDVAKEIDRLVTEGHQDSILRHESARNLGRLAD